MEEGLENVAWRRQKVNQKWRRKNFQDSPRRVQNPSKMAPGGHFGRILDPPWAHFGRIFGDIFASLSDASRQHFRDLLPPPEAFRQLFSDFSQHLNPDRTLSRQKKLQSKQTSPSMPSQPPPPGRVCLIWSFFLSNDLKFLPEASWTFQSFFFRP